ncbi:Canalicular multispecific organic anion transporter 1 [Homalodisca vitripennis]|nr:Canalicular multispecific organic anion transporter 1 [Homalodisca vitripennis]
MRKADNPPTDNRELTVLKLYAWEPSFEQKINNIRRKEINVLRTAAYYNTCSSFVYLMTPYLVALASFACFVLYDDHNILDAQTAFVSLSLFNILRFPLSMLPQVLNTFVLTAVSIKRINKFLNNEELDPHSVTHDHSEGDPIVVEDGTFSWESGDDNSIVLRNINVRVPASSLVAVVGSVGSGKSSLLAAVLGEMDKLSGKVNTKGSIAYVPQIAWIQNATLRENITCAHEFDMSTFKKVVKACALEQDLEMLPGGDMTEIGEKGINLSGGQKQRISLARAVYSKADVYLLDDPLSAVDSHVGKHIFENVIGPNGALHGKSTRVFVSTACSRTLWRDVTAHQSYGAECCARIDVATKSSVGTEVLKDKILRILVGDQDIFLTKFLVDGLDLKPGPEILRGGTTLMDCYSKIPCRQSRCQVWT